MKIKRCYQCQLRLNEDGECPNGCTDNEDYAFGEGFYADEDEMSGEEPDDPNKVN